MVGREVAGKPSIARARTGPADEKRAASCGPRNFTPEHHLRKYFERLAS